MEGIPGNRSGHVANMYLERYMMLHGGENEEEHLNDLWLYDTKNNYWHECQQEGDILSKRESHACCKVTDKFYFFGGEGPSFGLKK